MWQDKALKVAEKKSLLIYQSDGFVASERKSAFPLHNKHKKHQVNPGKGNYNMTQNKNKKGIAKKALSISLVAAMLATSNVPVWASGFTAENFDAEAQVQAEGFEVEETTPAAENEVVADFDDSVSTQADAWNQGYKSTIEVTAPSWDSAPTVTGEVFDKVNNENRVDAYTYTWYVNGVQRGNTAITMNGSAGILAPELTSADCGASLSLNVTKYADDAHTQKMWEFNINADQSIQKVDVSKFQSQVGQTKTIKFFDGQYGLNYSGQEQKLSPVFKLGGKLQLTQNDFTFDYYCTAGTNNFTDAGTVTVTATPTNSKLYTGSLTDSYTIAPAVYQANDITAELKNEYKTYEYTGNAIDIPLEDIKLVDTKGNRNLDISSAVVDVDHTGTTVGVYNNTQKARVYFDETLLPNYTFAGGIDAYNYVELDSYQIVARNLSDGCYAEIDPIAFDADKVVSSNDNRFEGKIHIYDKNGQELNLDYQTDYQVVVQGSPKYEGSYTVTIRGNDVNATGSFETNFSIINQTFDGAYFKGLTYSRAAEPYTGETVSKDLSKLGDLMDVNNKAISPENYDITFEGQNAGINAGRIVITGKLSYAGAKLVIPFNITPAVVTQDDVTAIEEVVFDPSFNTAADYKPAITVKAHNTAAPAKEFTLTEGTDYRVTYSFTDSSEGNKVGNRIQARIQILNANFLGGTSRFVNADNTTLITKKQLGVTVTAEPSSYTYTGSLITPTLKVMDGDEELYEGVDYEIVSIANGINVGTATATIRGINGYDTDSTATVEYTITPADISGVKVTTTEDVVYTGKPVKPSPEDIQVTFNGVDVKDQVRISYPTASIDAGTGTMTLTPGTNNKNFTGTTTAEYTINPAELSGSLKVYDKNNNLIDVTKEEFTYEAKEFTFAKAVFTPSGSMADLVTEDDYEITYIDNKYGPTAYICVVGKNNFAGTAQYQRCKGYHY